MNFDRKSLMGFMYLSWLWKSAMHLSMYPTSFCLLSGSIVPKIFRQLSYLFEIQQEIV